MAFSIKFSPLTRAALITGALVGTSYIPFPPWALFFCMVPLWISWIDVEKPRSAFWSGWLAQFTLTIIGFHWVAHTAVEYGHLPWIIAILVLFGFAAHANLHFAVAGWLWVRIFKTNRRSWPALIALVGLTALCELLMPQIFDWHMGYPWFWGRLPGFHFADIIGFKGLSVLSLAINGAVLKIWISFKEHDRRWNLAKLAAAVIIFNLLGWLYSLHVPAPDGKLKVLAVQANIGNFEKFAAEKNSDFRAPIVQKYFELTRRGILNNSNLDLIVWPETAFPSNLHPLAQNSYYPSQLKAFVTSLGMPLLTGGYTDEPSTGKYFNSLYYIEKDGTVSGTYHKSQLLAFGEYFPGSDYFPFLKTVIPEISDFGRGAGPSLIKSGSIYLGAQICYEGLFPEFSRSLSRQGAHVFVNVTNDSWFGHTFESRQHLYMTLARAVEFRRPLLRVTNTGISAGVDALGNVLFQSPQLTEWFGAVEIPYLQNPKETQYSLWGFVLPYLVSVLMIGWGYLRNARQS